MTKVKQPKQSPSFFNHPYAHLLNYMSKYKDCNAGVGTCDNRRQRQIKSQQIMTCLLVISSLTEMPVKCYLFLYTFHSIC